MHTEINVPGQTPNFLSLTHGVRGQLLDPRTPYTIAHQQRSKDTPETPHALFTEPYNCCHLPSLKPVCSGFTVSKKRACGGACCPFVLPLPLLEPATFLFPVQTCGHLQLYSRMIWRERAPSPAS